MEIASWQILVLFGATWVVGWFILSAVNKNTTQILNRIDKVTDHVERFMSDVGVDTEAEEKRKEQSAKIDREIDEWEKEKKDALAYIESQRKLIEEGKLEESSYSSMEELEEDLKQLLHEHKEREED
jgi:hypothetical protein